MFNTTIAAGDAGNLIVNTGKLIIRDGGGITTQSASIRTPSGQFIPATGRGGNLIVNAADVEIDGFISALSQGVGNAGNISINVRDTLQLNNGQISTRCQQSSGGAIDITAGAIRLQDNSNIVTVVLSDTGSGGNITLNARSIIALDDSDILAFSRDGSGGNITLKTPIFFGLGYAPAPPGTDPKTLDRNDRVDINASGALSNGTITLPNVNPSQALIALPANVIGPSELIANSCIGRSNIREGKFIITGNGGLPVMPDDPPVASYQTYQIPTVESASISVKRDRSFAGVGLPESADRFVTTNIPKRYSSCSTAPCRSLWMEV